MNIVNKQELGKLPNGTVFAQYTPMILYNNIRILTGSSNNGSWNGELCLFPFIDDKLEGGNCLECNWSTVDNTASDYDEDQLFAVFDKPEVQQMINALTWALTGCEGYFDENVWFCGGRVYPEEIYLEAVTELQ